MKKSLFILIAGLALLSLSYISVQAQTYSNDATTAKVLVDNDHITATEVTFMPGKKTNMHTHPAHFIYALTDGSLLVTMENGEEQTFELKAGDSGYFEPEGPHATVNKGKKAIKIILVEFKDKPYMADKMSKK